MKPVIRDVTLTKQFHQTFFQWLDVNQSRFATPAFEILGGHRVVRLTMPGLHKALHFALYSRGIAMSYVWQGVLWTLKTFEAFPVDADDQKGFVDGLCLDECPVVNPSRESLWAEQIFEPFLAWINRELPPPRWLARHRLARPLTEAHFIDAPDPNWRVILPMWTHQAK